MTDWTTYQHAGEEFTLDHPATWSIHLSLMGSLAAIAEPEAERTDGFASNVNVVSVPSSDDLARYVKGQIASMADLLVDFRVIETSTEGQGELPIARITATYRQGVHHLTLEQLHVLTPDKAYIVSASALSQRYDALADTFDRMLESFRLPSASPPA